MRAKNNSRSLTANVLVLILVIYLLFSVHDAIAKALVLKGYDPLYVTWVRFAVHTLLCVFFLKPWSSPKKYTLVSSPLHLVRGVLIVVNTLLNFIALQYLQLAETISIFLSVPLIVACLAIPLLGEAFSYRRLLCILMGFVGVLIIVRPGSDIFGWPVLLSMGSAIGFSLFVITTKYMKSAPSESLLLYPGMIAVLLLSPAAYLTGVIPSTITDMLMFLALGIFGMLGQWCLIIATKHVDVSVITPAMYTQLLWMILIGWLYFEQLPDGYTLIGGLIIVFSGIALWHSELNTNSYKQD